MSEEDLAAGEFVAEAEGLDVGDMVNVNAKRLDDDAGTLAVKVLPGLAVAEGEEMLLSTEAGAPLEVKQETKSESSPTIQRHSPSESFLHNSCLPWKQE